MSTFVEHHRSLKCLQFEQAEYSLLVSGCVFVACLFSADYLG